jgi:uncharacterized damage-inducible protein DinB
MGERAQTLAEAFQRANEELIATVERCSDAGWAATTPGEGWTVAATAHHVAGGHQTITGLVQTIVQNLPRQPLSMDLINQMNAQHAEEFAHCSKEETLTLLRTNGTAAAQMVRGLSDEQLDQQADLLGGTWTVQRVIEAILIGHVQQHLASIRAALDA